MRKDEEAEDMGFKIPVEDGECAGRLEGIKGGVPEDGECAGRLEGIKGDCPH